MSLLLLYSSDPLTIIISSAVGLFAVFILRKINYVRSGLLFITSACAIVSASVSMFTSLSLVCNFSLNSSFVPICTFLAAVVILCILYSSNRAIKSVVCVASALCGFLLLLMLFLCFFESDKSFFALPNINPYIIFPLISFALFDNLFFIPEIKKSDKKPYYLGILAAVLYFVFSSVLSLSVLSTNIYSATPSPVIRLWSTCFVVSFVDRFETVVVCVLFTLCVLKCGLLLKTVKSFHPILRVFLAMVLMILLFFYPLLIIFYSIIVIIGLIVYVIIKKYIDL